MNAETNIDLTSTMVREESVRLKALGPPIQFTFLRSESVIHATGYDFLVFFRRARMVESVALDSHGMLAGIDFRVFVRQQ